MNPNSDIYVFYLIVAGLLLWGWMLLKKWLMKPAAAKLSFLKNASFPEGKTAGLLKQFGYEVVSGKVRVPLTVSVDGKRYQSRIYIDYIVQKDGKLYAARIERGRQPVKWSGSSLRDQFFAYCFLDPGLDGVVHIDEDKQQIKLITMRIASERKL